jgi:hypothetical protein
MDNEASGPALMAIERSEACVVIASKSLSLAGSLGSDRRCDGCASPIGFGPAVAADAVAAS